MRHLLFIAAAALALGAGGRTTINGYSRSSPREVVTFKVTVTHGKGMRTSATKVEVRQAPAPISYTYGRGAFIANPYVK